MGEGGVAQGHSPKQECSQTPYVSKNDFKCNGLVGTRLSVITAQILIKPFCVYFYREVHSQPH